MNKLGWVMACSIGAALLAGPGGLANSAPRAESQVVYVLPGRPAAFRLQGSDPDGDPLTYTILGGPRYGRLEGTVPHLTYVPEGGFQGTDELTYSVKDPYGAMDLGMVKLRVTPLITARVVGQSDAASETGLAGLVEHLARQQVRVWYVFSERTAVFAIGQPIPVLLPPGGEVNWAGLSQTGPEGIRLVPVAGDWDPKGWLRVATQYLSPGSYILTVVKDHQAFSFLIALKGAPTPGTHLAVGDPREEQGG